MDIETITTQRNSADKDESRMPEEAKSIAPAVLTCIPGIIPVNVPIDMPIKQAMTNSIIAINCMGCNLSFVEANIEKLSDF